ncbi:ABC-type tungstate transport system substrate-binding protein [Paenibacillus castaneae]|uniref:PLDc N-terminal domain-containing protein n=1 Tax=Paenibacillus castaneae TaxID=474957 RepID=UPI000C9BF835|nr:PLDc N-terminal domain-containing protein [Paenibacillus castaneae]NIK75676.1 ABC-type tungstate transport system substrate-binding protein [Paenibacillus castaneae]
MSYGFGFIGLAFLFVGLFLFILHIVSCVWAYRDAIRNGRSTEFAILVLLAILFFPVLGLIIYLLIRNDGGRPSRRY